MSFKITAYPAEPLKFEIILSLSLLEYSEKNSSFLGTTYPSIPSELIADVCKQAKKRGYKKIITYTRQDEKGNYYKACGFNIVYRQKTVGLWKSKNGKKVNTKSTPCPKNRWEKIL